MAEFVTSTKSVKMKKSKIRKPLKERLFTNIKKKTGSAVTDWPVTTVQRDEQNDTRDFKEQVVRKSKRSKKLTVKRDFWICPD